MLIAERRRRLLAHVRDHGYVSFRDLAAALGISESTVRRDLRAMAADGLLALTRGGAGPRHGQPPVRAVAPAGPNGADPVSGPREAIAARAAGLVAEGSAVLLGPGRTTTALARHLAAFDQLTVVTNSISVTSALLGAPQVDVVLIGGALRRSIGAAVGPIAEAALTGLRGAQVFLSGEGVTVERGLTTPNVFAAATDQALMAAGQQVVVLADHTKLGRETMCQTVPPERIDVLVTDQAADGEMVERLRATGIDIHVA
ncbi:DeoR/GlpR family DNA-binding transcription regulator [Actinoplanes sp. NPDC024001]|uniref:DeoR/GlpR family DNA-binding transcription regulator n=1 Tax=Actinoplanes sp. NPDC024001 TaxID=3154598 RepID=UPI0033FA632D